MLVNEYWHKNKDRLNKIHIFIYKPEVETMCVLSLIDHLITPYKKHKQQFVYFWCKLNLQYQWILSFSLVALNIKNTSTDKANVTKHIEKD